MKRENVLVIAAVLSVVVSLAAWLVPFRAVAVSPAAVLTQSSQEWNPVNTATSSTMSTVSNSSTAPDTDQRSLVAEAVQDHPIAAALTTQPANESSSKTTLSIPPRIPIPKASLAPVLAKLIGEVDGCTTKAPLSTSAAGIGMSLVLKATCHSSSWRNRGIPIRSSSTT